MGTREPLILIAADVRIEGRIRAQHPPEATAAAAPGQEVQLLVRYKIAEASTDREAYDFTFESSVGGRRPAPVRRGHRDAIVLKDEWAGIVGHRYTFDRPGTYEGMLRCTVEYRRSAWLGLRRKTVDRHEVQVPVRIEVR